METMRQSAVLSTNSPEYLVQLLKDKRQLQAVPGCFVHLERILDEGEPPTCPTDLPTRYVDFHVGSLSEIVPYFQLS